MQNNYSKTSLTVAITIDENRIMGALVAADGTLSAVNALPNSINESQDSLVSTIMTVCKQVMLEADAHKLSGIGIVIAAPIDREDRHIHFAEKLPQLEKFNLKNHFQQTFSLLIAIENDVNAMALLEAHAGVGQGEESIFYVSVEDDIKGAIIQNEEIWRGSHSHAGEIGYLVAGWMGTKAITLGQRASGHGITAEYNMRSRKNRVPTLDEVIQYARQGDHLAIRVIRDGAQILGSVLSPVMNLLDPSLIVVGGRFAHSGDLWWQNFSTAFNEANIIHLGVTDLARSQYNEDAALQGAALISRLSQK